MSQTQKFQWASAFNQWTLASVAPDTYQWPAPSIVQFADLYSSGTFSFRTNAPVLITDLGTPANTEVTTPSAVSTLGFTPTSLSHAHTTFLVSSGTAGLQEAINNAGAGSAAHPFCVLLDTDWWAAAAVISSGAAILAAAKGSTSVVIIDTTSTPWTFYQWNGSAYAAASTPAGVVTANGASILYGSASELLTLSTSGATSDTAANLLPATSIIDGVVYRVTETINNVTSWQPGDPTTAGRFGATQTSGQLTAGATFVGNVFDTTGIASATTGMYQLAAAKARITTAGGSQNTTGKIRITVFYHTLTPPTS